MARSALPSPADRRTVVELDAAGFESSFVLGHGWGLETHDRLMRVELARHGGTEIDTAGDGFLSTFTMPKG